MKTRPRKILPEERRILIEALGDKPESVIFVHLLARGLAGDAYVAGGLTRPGGVIVQSASDPGELMSFGSDAAVLWEILRLAEGWWCVSVIEPCAGDLGAMLEAQTSSEIRYYADICHVLRDPVARLHHEAVRLLAPDDLGLVEAAPAEVRDSGWGSAGDARGRRGGRRCCGGTPRVHRLHFGAVVRAR